MEVIAMEWETPEFEEIGTSAEVTAYVFLGE
jgi:coenzyme PQQ precursor peptide PqqA